jgi:polyisoprenoid-binding protein YceI
MQGNRWSFRAACGAAALAMVLLATGSAAAATAHYEILEGSEISFESKAPLETFHGRTQEVRGWFEADLNDPVGTVQLEVTVDLASFDTGNKKRNGHMRENHFETEQFPEAWFRGGEVTDARAEEGVTILTLSGELDLHGVRQPVTCDITLEYRTDGTLAMTTEFPVKLSDHAIKRPRFLVMKLADEQKVRIRLKAGPGREAASE